MLLILGVDTFLDMGRSATNAVGNSVAASVVAKWEGGLLSEKEAEANAARLDAETVAARCRRTGAGGRVSRAASMRSRVRGTRRVAGTRLRLRRHRARAHRRRKARSTGTLQKVRASGEVAIGYREASIPLSYLSARNEPIGYSIDLCRAIVDAMSTEVGRDLVIKWVPVTSDNRIKAVTGGQVDLECGSTTSNLERKKVVDFSPVIFIAGTKLMVKKGSPIKSFRDLAGRSVVVTTGTTNEKTMRELVAKFKLNTTIVTGRDHADSYAQLVEGKVDAFATDDVLLYGFIALNRAQDQLDGRWRVPVVRSLRHHVSQGRSAAGDASSRRRCTTLPPRASSSRPTTSGSCASCPLASG